MHQMLVDPASPYSATVDRPAFTNDLDWLEVVAGLPGNASSEDALAALYRDLGLGRARPGIDVTPSTGFRDAFLGANAAKASVDADIFWHTLDMAGYRHSARAATYAVAIQILRWQMATTAPERWAAVGIDAGVFKRFMATQHLGDLADYDLEYLGTLVQHRLIHREVAASGVRELPVAFRVARVAAAYRDAQGYFVAPPCRSDASPAPRNAGTGTDGDDRPLCFVAATDRAVHRWYRDEVRREAASAPQREHSSLQRAFAFIGAILALVDLAPLVEVMEAVTADELATAEILTPAEAEVASERADVLSCAIPE
ncbi:hypothetical protein [Luteibacter sp.]|jgi:hypothetical protein|uniref:hypothetical protein n=1 Tax=Luteibacter sp. TaxID=1886636 RepID=UPI002F413EB0